MTTTLGVRWNTRAATVCLVVLVALLLVTAVGVTIGEYPIPLAQLPELLTGGGHRIDRHILFDLRVPRAVTGCVAGACLAMAGALTQTISRNSLATPDILGVTGGASAAAVAVIVFGGGVYSLASGITTIGVPAAALVGGLIAAAAVYGFSWRHGVDGFRLVLVGIGCGAVLTALTSWLLILASINSAAQATVWLVGSISAVSWDQAIPLLILAALLVPAALTLPRTLAVAQLGDDAAAGLGVRIQASRLGAIGVAVGLTAAAVAAAGPIGFVALVTPQIMLRLTGGSRPPLVASALGGALLVQASDLLGRTAFSWEVPVGLITAAIGAPYLIWLLLRRR
ncbi:FecCD family ABC transporter permease [Amycolatopsis thermoflava]|uniref:FecCD family ABC transporter permease n=1 Tax=Amycolatopsis thermoflava TaxID=84480 RepID=UPI003EB8661B